MSHACSITVEDLSGGIPAEASEKQESGIESASMTRDHVLSEDQTGREMPVTREEKIRPATDRRYRGRAQ